MTALRLRFLVLERDGFRCVYCGRGPKDAVLHVDHVSPQSKGGADTLGNLVTACEFCNLGKGDRILRDAGPILAVTRECQCWPADSHSVSEIAYMLSLSETEVARALDLPWCSHKRVRVDLFDACWAITVRTSYWPSSKNPYRSAA